MSSAPPITQTLARLSRRRPRRSRRSINKIVKRWVYDGYEVKADFVNQSKKDVFIGASDVSDYLHSSIAMERNDRCIATEHREVTVLATRGQWMNTVDKAGLRVVKFGNDSGSCIEDETLSYFKYNISANSIQIEMFGDFDFVIYWFEKFVEEFEPVHNVIEWMYSSDGQSIEVPLRNDRIPVDEMYPWLEGRTLAEYYDSYIASDASILLLIGPPGTGKTTFIRGLLQHTKQSAIVTYDANILAKDYVFAQFIEGDRSIMVIEDADNFLGARTDGNDVMHKFLNVGDGLVTTKNKKLIFSTNLPSIKDVDAALIRPGRCFDIVNFDMLTTEQAIALAHKLGADYNPYSSDKHSIADIFHKQVQAPKTKKRTMGFV